MSVAATDRTLPFNLDAEKSVLGAIIVENESFNLAVQIVEPADFYNAAHRRIFGRMIALKAQNQAIDYVTLKNELDRAKELDDVGGPAYVASLSDGVPRATNIEYYARIVKEKATLRNLIFAANGLLASAYDASDPSSEIIDAGVRSLLAIAPTTTARAVKIGDVVRTYVSELDTPTVAFSTGLRDLDDVLRGGLKPTDLVIVAARPSVGKTTLACNMADAMAKAGIPVGMFSLEMGDAALAEQALARSAHIDAQRLVERSLGSVEYRRIADALEVLADRPFYIVSETRTLTQVQAWCRRLRDDHGVRVFIVDYIQLLGHDDARDRQQEIAAISRGLKGIAKELDAVMIGISQLSRAPEARTDKRPQLSDLRESGALEQDADVAILLFRAEMYKPTDDNAGVAELIVAKHRKGPVGTAKAAFLKEQGRFADLALV